MDIKVHRGTHQIGGCVTEYEHNGYRLFVDYGEELPGGPKKGGLQVDNNWKGYRYKNRKGYHVEQSFT